MTPDPSQPKRLVSGVFDRAAPSYDSVAGSYFSVLGPRLIDKASIRETATVVDIACGKGATLVNAAERVGPEATLIGVDISLEMVRHARSRATSGEFTNISVAVMDAEQLALRDARADALICGFSLHFFPDPLQAVREFVRIVVPDGTVAISEWGPTDERWSWEDDLVRALPVEGVSSGSFETPAALESLLSSAGLRDIDVETESLTVRLADEDEWWTWKWSYSFRHMLEQLDVDARDRFKAEALERLRGMRDEDGIPLTLHALMAVARKTG
ncbi:MAG: class I SAM-dependent methyltransferase [Actinomycetota bacterium]